MHRVLRRSAAVLATVPVVAALSYAGLAATPRCSSYAVTSCPVEQGCVWTRDPSMNPKQMCKTLCNQGDPCSGPHASCCSWTWTNRKVGSNCGANPLECWEVTGASEMWGVYCAFQLLGQYQWYAYDCCDQQESPAQCHAVP